MNDSTEGQIMSAEVRTSLVASGNTYNPCLIVLREKGYDLWLEEGEDSSLWCACKDHHSFMAYSGPELLGLVVLHEELGEGWNRQVPDIYGELVDKIVG